MAITAFDPKTALIVVDLQKGIVALNTCHPTQTIIDNTSQIITAFRDAKLPIILVNVAGVAQGRTEQIGSNSKLPANWSHLINELNPTPSDHIITKKTWGAFTNTDLASYLVSHDITQVVIVGIATSIGVESTARQAWELGYNVTLPIDAMTDLNINAHRNSVNIIFPRLSETGTTQDLLGLINSQK
ncbi:cysteine hydrolase family protein [Aliivibrio logei]|uniref:Hydrolase n=1 Tax=Aliivibrio logei 5S-186 TaxID=626086 RepID=A0ABX3ARD6_ALILO|nr:isochorismatase family cysteine hydrolase [Aliivibrio logei]OEF10736.1 hydrolase [Aliivibrio logei 5S-186]